MDQPLGITIESLAPDTVCVALSGELDFSRAYTFDEEMRRLESQKPDSIVLDLRKLNFIDSAGLGRVLAVQRLLDKLRDSKNNGDFFDRMNK